MVTISNLKELLSPAYEHKFAVLACNVRHPLIMQACLDAAFQVNAPLILQISESEHAYCDWSFSSFAAHAIEKITYFTERYGYQIPVGLHVDHVQKNDELILEALMAGFRSALLDLSMLPDEENHARCKTMIEKVHTLNASLEVEQGAIGFAKDLPEDVNDIEKLYTTVEQALAMVEAVHPDALAIAVGNGHGTYTETPHIGFDRIRDIANALKSYKTPLVLHGGSGLQSMFKKAVESGINKVNYATELTNILFQNLPEDLLAKMNKAAKEKGIDLRKVIGQFKIEINQISQERKAALHQDIVKQIIKVISEGLGSANTSHFYS